MYCLRWLVVGVVDLVVFVGHVGVWGLLYSFIEGQKRKVVKIVEL